MRSARLGQGDAGVGAQADVRAFPGDHGALDPRPGARRGDVEVEAVAVLPGWLRFLTERADSLPIVHLFPHDERDTVAF